MVLLLVCAAAAALAATIHFRFSQAGNFPGATYTYPLAVGAKDIIVGYYEAPELWSGYIQRGSTFKAIAPPGSPSSYVSGINRHSVMVGGFCDNGCNAMTGMHGFTYDHGTFTTIDYPNLPMGSSTTAYGINNLGQIVGGYCLKAPNCPPGAFLPPTHGFLDDHGAFTTLDYPGAVATGAAAINDAGAIVGTYDIGLTGPHSFLYQNGFYINIDFPNANFTVATAINNDGLVAGYYTTTSGNEYGFEFQNGTFTTIEAKGATATVLNGLNDAGVIVGFWNNGVTQETFKGIPVRDDSE
jgi:probable HAF family extracellular repeat protein